jgi:cytochrome oxidase Cu insertion factor (SCO1/SenC/PrrC family)
MDILMWNREPVGGPFELTDHTGQPRTNSDFRGKLMLVYFGFTYCPDVCPTDLQAIGLALDKLGTDGDSVQPLFITVDPERDTPQHLAEYVPMFHPRLIGLTGSAEAIRKAADAYKVYYAKVDPPKGDGGYYTVDHTAFIYLMDREGNYLGFFPPGTSADRMVEIIRPRLGETAR